MGSKFLTFKTSFKIIHQNITIAETMDFTELNEKKTIRRRRIQGLSYCTEKHAKFLSAFEQFLNKSLRNMYYSLICFHIDHAKMAMTIAHIL
jgi:hypothetical protein